MIRGFPLIFRLIAKKWNFLKRQLYVSQTTIFEVEDFCYQFFNAHMKKRYNFVLPFDLEVSKLASMRQSREFP